MQRPPDLTNLTRSAPEPPAKQRLAWPVAHPIAWFTLLALAHVTVRVAISPALKWDEAEQMVWSQQLALGYGPQPPLYTWLQWTMNQLVGPSVLSLSLLKHALLALVYIGIWLAARELLAPNAAWWASASMVLLPALGWDSVRDQTHSILVTAAVTFSWWMLIRLVKHTRPRDFAWLGLLFGLGVQSKYTFALFAVLLVLAALSMRELRQALLAPGWWWTPVVALAVALPHGLWLLEHLQLASSETLHKLDIQHTASIARGLLNLMIGWFSTLLIWLVLALWAFGPAWWRPPSSARPNASTHWMSRLMLRYLIGLTVALIGMVWIAHVTHFKGRWLLPLQAALPLAALCWRPELEAHPHGRRFTWSIVALSLLLLFLALVRPWVLAGQGSIDDLNQPAAQLAQALQKAGYDGAGRIVAADHLLAGTLRTRFPRSTVEACPDTERAAACAASALEQAHTNQVGWLIVSRNDRLPEGWWSSLAPTVDIQKRQAIQLPYLHTPAGHTPAHYDYVWHPVQKLRP